MEPKAEEEERWEIRTAGGLFEALSFLSFLLISAAVATITSGFLWLYALLVAIDAMATLFRRDDIAVLDRAAFFLSFVVEVVAAAGLGYDLLLISSQVLLVMAALDFSLFIRKLAGTVVDPSVLAHRLRSYAITVIPAFLVSFAVTYSISQLPPLPTLLTSSSFEILIILLGGSTVGAFAIVYALARYISSFERS